jgi:hypothetical protein
MDRALGIVAVLIVAALALPVLADWLQAAVPMLLSILVLLGLARLVWPGGRRR